MILSSAFLELAEAPFDAQRMIYAGFEVVAEAVVVVVSSVCSLVDVVAAGPVVGRAWSRVSRSTVDGVVGLEGGPLPAGPTRDHRTSCRSSSTTTSSWTTPSTR